MFKVLTDPKEGVIKDLSEIDAIGHRVVHGMEYFNKSVLITPEVIEKVKECYPVAPLHNPANLGGILSHRKSPSRREQVAVFDTSFHQTLPATNFMYALPYEYYQKYGIRKYGFHGTSHKFVAREGAKLAGLDINNSKIITCHIGNGGSITAVLNGKSYDTSMGFSPVDGLVMGTRCGNVDPSAVTFSAKEQ